MSSWTALYGGAVDGDPVRGPFQPFDDEAQRCYGTAQDVGTVAAEFRLVDAGAAVGLRGRTAQALGTPVQEVRHRLDPIERIFRDLERVLSTHARELALLRRQAAHALARATAAHRLRQVAQRRRTDAHARACAAEKEGQTADRVLASIQMQLVTLDASPEGNLRRAALESRQDEWLQRKSHSASLRRRASAETAAADRDIRTARDRLHHWRAGSHERSWVRLRGREEELNASTAGRIRALDLTGIEDPGGLRTLFQDVAGWLTETVAFVQEAVERAVRAFVATVSAYIDLVNLVLAGVAIIGAIFAQTAVLGGDPTVLMWAVVGGVALIVVLELWIMEATYWGLGKVVPIPGERTGDISLPTSGYASKVVGETRQRRDLDLALLARDAYGAPNGDGVPSRLTDDVPFRRLSAKEVEEAGIDPSSLEDRTAGFRAVLYLNEQEGGYVLAFEGSSAEGLSRSPFGELAEGQKDYLAYGNRQNIGFPSEQYNLATSLAYEVKRQLGNNVVYTGHSLGGGLATTASLATGNPAVTFNAAGIHRNTLRGLGYPPDLASSHAESGLIRRYTTAQDPLTNWAQENPLLPLPEALGTHIEVGGGGHGIDDLISGLRRTQ